jgi:hypothetical protein
MSRPIVPLLLTGAALLASGCSLQTRRHGPQPSATPRVRGALKPAERPCAARGIAPGGGPEGTCRAASGATVTLVDLEHDLRMPSLWGRAAAAPSRS